MKKKLIMISFDAVSTKDIEYLLTKENFGAVAEQSALVTDVDSIYISNTYPAHASIITGCQPVRHGIFENTVPVPFDNDPDWHWAEKLIKVPTLPQILKKQGRTTAAILWPVTARSKSIKYNIAEVRSNRWWKPQILFSIYTSSFMFLLKSYLKYGSRVKGALQPQLDDFTCDVAVDVVKNKNVDLLLIHLTDVDFKKHDFGNNHENVTAALDRMDERLGRIVDALKEKGEYENTSIIVFGDHAQKDVTTRYDPNVILQKYGLQDPDAKHYDYFFHCCDGSAFLYKNNKSSIIGDDKVISLIKEHIKDTPEIKRIVGLGELGPAGYVDRCVLAIEAADTVFFKDHPYEQKATHGYTLKQPDYTTFYMAKDSGFLKGVKHSGGNITDIGATAFNIMGISTKDIDGQVKEEIKI